jgi:hypothetical protein
MDEPEMRVERPSAQVDPKRDRPFILAWIVLLFVTAALIALSFYLENKHVPYLPSILRVGCVILFWDIVERGRRMRKRREGEKQGS